MTPNNQGPLGPDQGQIPNRRFTQKALAAKFSFSFTRGQLLSLSRVFSAFEIRPIDPAAKDICDIVDEIDRTAFRALTDTDYEKPPEPDTSVSTNNVKVN